MFGLGILVWNCLCCFRLQNIAILEGRPMPDHAALREAQMCISFHDSMVVVQINQIWLPPSETQVRLQLEQGSLVEPSVFAEWFLQQARMLVLQQKLSLPGKQKQQLFFCLTWSRTAIPRTRIRLQASSKACFDKLEVWMGSSSDSSFGAASLGLMASVFVKAARLKCTLCRPKVNV